MINPQTKNTLLIFDQFHRDQRLPKFRLQDGGVGMPRNFVGTIDLDTPTFNVPARGFNDDPMQVLTGFFDQLTPAARKKIGLPEKPPVKKEEFELTVEEFFASMKNTKEELEIVKERAAGYQKAYKSAERAGQTARMELLAEQVRGLRAEAQIIALAKTNKLLKGIIKYVEEKSVVDAATKSPRGIRLDWLENFTRDVPDEAIEKKLFCDNREIFDNYVVMHYDPESNGVALTKEEKRKKSDPILFGVMEGRRRLYFIHDWVDEFCDLTLDKFADLVGKNAIGELK